MIGLFLRAFSGELFWFDFQIMRMVVERLIGYLHTCLSAFFPLFPRSRLV